jgi:hypothetical protein
LEVTDTVADASVAASLSAAVTPGSTATGVEVVLSPAVKLVLPLVVVTMSAASTSTVLVAAALLSVPSLTTKETMRVPVVVALDANVTASRALAHWASVAVAPVLASVSTPVEALYDEAPMLPNSVELLLLKAKVSPLRNPLVIETVPDASVPWLGSVTTTPLSTAVAVVPDV